MKLPAAFLLLAWLASCSFPEFQVPAPSNEPVEPMPTCVDGKRNGEETGIDCGLTACGAACPAGQGCRGDDDCQSARCVEDRCRAESCADGAKNGDEADVDCGGDSGCARCAVGSLCNARSDCDGGDCLQRRCQAISCRDGLRNGGESDVDCGGDCSDCSVGRACVTNADCDATACASSICQIAGCEDGVVNQDETDVDCGGSCGVACADGARCEQPEDCQSGVCAKPSLRCAPPACDDAVLNGGEPSVDCGATCPEKCAQLEACTLDADCATNSCVTDRCLPAAATGEKLSPLGWVATASHSANPQTNSPQLAIDGAQQTDWATGTLQALGMWFQIDMQKTEVFFSLEIDSINQPSDAAGAFNVYVSESDAFPEPPVLTSYQAKTAQLVIPFAKPQVGRYIKLVLSEGGDKWWRMDEIRVKR